jgi:hypothetical protein
VDLASELSPGDAIDVACRLDSRRFAGLESLQIEILDVAPAGHVRGLRGTTGRIPEAALAGLSA